MTRLALFLLSLLLLATPAAAAPSRLDRLLAEGETLTRAADARCATSLEAAALAAESSDADYARALGALGLCREVQGRFADAHGLVSRALESAPPETTPAGKRAPWPVLRAALRRLDDRVARVLVTWEDGAELFVDGHLAGGTSGRVMAVDPGRRLFEARRNGKTVAAKEVEARAGDLPAVHLRAQETLSEHKDPSPSQSPSFTAIPSPTTSSTTPLSQSLSSPLVPGLSPRGVAVGAAYLGGAVALVSAIAAGVLEAQRQALASSLPEGACVDPSAPRCAELRLAYDQRTAARNTALVAAGFAVAAGGVAVGLHFTADRAPGTGMVTVGARW